MSGRPEGVHSILAACVMALLAAGCDRSPIEPTPDTPPAGPKISCPAPQTVPSLDGQSVMVSYPFAMVSGGVAPVPVSCTPPSGAMFPVGSTSVLCVATDARQRIDSCSFSITVQPPLRSSATTFTAFGDSITEGL